MTPAPLRSRFGWTPGGSEAEARAALCRLGRHLYRRGLVAGGAGNLSLRLDHERLLVTPRGVHKGFLRPPDPVCLAPADPSPGDVARATSELPFHLAAHAALGEPCVVLHTHPPALTALGMRAAGRAGRPPGNAPMQDTPVGESLGLPPELDDVVGPVARVAFHPSGSARLAAAVGTAVEGGGRLLLLERHGVVALGSTLEEALDRTELAELGARAALLVWS